jgi:hypothetical protein
MPHDEICPYPDCGKTVKDWFIEWYSIPNQYEIGRQKLAMDCPYCRRPVMLSKRRPVIPAHAMDMEPRSYDAATRYARSLVEGYPTLEAFLADPNQAQKAAPYQQGYWPHVNIP